MALRTFSNKTLQDNWYEDRIQGHEDVPFSERDKVLCEKTSDIAFIMTSSKDRERVYEPPLPIPRICRLENPSSARTMPCYNQYVSRDYKTTSGTSSNFWTEKKKELRATRKMITADTIQCAPTPASPDFVPPKTEQKIDSNMFETVSQAMFPPPMQRQTDVIQAAREEAAERQGKSRTVGGKPAPKAAEALGKDFFKRNAIMRDQYTV